MHEFSFLAYSKTIAILVAANGIVYAYIIRQHIDISWSRFVLW